MRQTAAVPEFTHCPKCVTELLDAPGIGQFCPNRACDVADGILVAAGLAAPFVIKREPAVPEIDAEAAAALLRSLGWTVTPPVDPKAAIPEPEGGQVWRSPNPRIKLRTVVGLEWGAVPVVRYSTPRYARLLVSTEGWRAWARRTGARP